MSDISESYTHNYDNYLAYNLVRTIKILKEGMTPSYDNIEVFRDYSDCVTLVATPTKIRSRSEPVRIRNHYSNIYMLVDVPKH